MKLILTEKCEYCDDGFTRLPVDSPEFQKRLSNWDWIADKNGPSSKVVCEICHGKSEVLTEDGQTIKDFIDSMVKEFLNERSRHKY